MNKTNTLIGALVILAILGFTLFFLNQVRLNEKETILQEQMAAHSQQQEMLLEAQQKMQAENEEAAKLAKQADEARRMAEAQAEKERLEREKLVADLNQRLKKEAAERKEAEAALDALEEKMKALEVAQAEAQAALAELEKAQAGAVLDADTVALKEKIRSQEASLAMLSQENQSLKERQQLLEQRQIQTEEAIVRAGGVLDIPYPEIRSPNIRRREAIYFKERILGQPGG
ncbi:MAG: hypothetical protein ACO3ZW_04845 [Opitutales bacterium]|jgi:chromosome segregation ATPase